jgi:hypothetical protein
MENALGAQARTQEACYYERLRYCNEYNGNELAEFLEASSTLFAHWIQLLISNDPKEKQEFAILSPQTSFA